MYAHGPGVGGRNRTGAVSFTHKRRAPRDPKEPHFFDHATTSPGPLPHESDKFAGRLLRHNLGSERSYMHAEIVRKLRTQALALVQAARQIANPDLSAQIEIIAIEILASASKLERDSLVLPQRRTA
jgi:hypothetical protein